jgi:hypothetical protein
VTVSDFNTRFTDVIVETSQREEPTYMGLASYLYVILFSSLLFLGLLILLRFALRR